MNIEIIGCTGEINDREELIGKLRSFGKESGVACQMMDAEVVYGREHIISAVEHAVRAFKKRTNSCKTLDMEILLYASGKRQIDDALKLMGIKNGNMFAFVSAGGTGIVGYNGSAESKGFIGSLGLKIDYDVINGNEITLKKFGIDKQELDAVDKSMYGDMILEKVAMVDIIK